MKDGLIMWGHEGQQGGTVVAYQPCVIRQIPTLTWTESRYRSFPFRATTCFFAKMRFSKLVTSFRVHTKQRGRDDGTLAQD